MAELEIHQIEPPSEDVQAAAWMKQVLDAEVSRLNSQGQRPIPLPVKNFGIITEHAQSRKKKTVIINRVEFGTAFNFLKVQQMLLKPSLPCPAKPNYLCNIIILLTDQPLPLIFAYLYQRNANNLLEDWRFVNSKLEECNHHWDFSSASKTDGQTEKKL